MKRMVEKRPSELREAEKHIVQALMEAPGNLSQEHGSHPQPQEETIRAQPQTWQEVRFARVKELQKQGMSQRAIARQLRIHRKTIGRYSALDHLPRRTSASQTSSKALPFLPYAQKRLEEGQRNRWQLLEEICTRGFGEAIRASGVQRRDSRQALKKHFLHKRFPIGLHRRQPGCLCAKRSDSRRNSRMKDRLCVGVQK